MQMDQDQPHNVKLQTQRLRMRELTDADFPALCKILQDPETMAAYEHGFTKVEVQEWLQRQIKRYQEYNHQFGLWAVVLRENGEMIGQCGLTLQPTPIGQVLEIGYLFQKDYWHHGYAIEAASACKQYAFHVLGAEEVFSIIRDTNIASQKLAKRNGMTVRGRFIKHYYGIDMPHEIFSVKNSNKY